MKVTNLAREIQSPYKFIDPTWKNEKLVSYGGQFCLRYSRHGKQKIALQASAQAKPSTPHRRNAPFDYTKHKVLKGETFKSVAKAQYNDEAK